MVMGEMTMTTDVVVIGSGPGGYAAAIRAGQLGKRVILVEKAELGGVCLNHGCIPAKALIHASDLFHKAKNSERLGISAKEITLDFSKLQAWKQGVVKKLTMGVEFLLKSNTVEIIKGEAFFEGSNRVKVAVEHAVNAIEFSKCIIATGVKHKTLPGFEIGKANVISSREALELKEVPKELLIVGADYISVEIANIYAKLGSKVSIVHIAEQLLPHIEKEAVAIIHKKLEELGVKIYFNSEAKGISSDGTKSKVKVKTKDGEQELGADKVLLSVGFAANLDSLQIKNTKVSLDEKGFIKINEKCQTTDSKIFAIGDCTGFPLLAHKAYRQAKVAAEVIAGLPSAFDNRVVPDIIFGEPEIAIVGMQEEEAIKKGKEIIVGKFPFIASGRAQTLSRTDGYVKAIADKKTKLILGMLIVGPSASDMITEAALAIEMAATLDDLAITIHPHPSLSEGLMEAAENAMGKAIHVQNVKK